MRRQLEQKLRKRGFSVIQGGNHTFVRYDNLNVEVQDAKRLDANNRLAYGLCEKYGIELPKGATPGEAWEALKEVTGKSASDIYAHSGEKGADKIRFRTSNPKAFVKNLHEAKMAGNPRDTWRVTDLSKEDLMEWHPNAKLHVTDGGSTIAIDDGNIVAFCGGPRDGKSGIQSGSSVLEFAVKNGGNKLDSYEGNHRFYAKNGFEAVSWCKWDKAYEGDARKQGWNPEKGDKEEAIIFYKYVGKGNVKNATTDDVFERIKPSPDYDTAMSIRDNDMKKKGK